MPFNFVILICPDHNILHNFNSNYLKKIIEWKSSLDRSVRRGKFPPLPLLNAYDWTKNKIDTDRLTGEKTI